MKDEGMHACPHCQQPTITSWRKVNASDIFPARCSACVGFSYTSAWAHVAMVLACEALFWGTIVLAIWLKSWLALLIFPLSLWLVSLAVGMAFNLKPIQIQIAKKRRLKTLRYSLLLGAVVLMIWGWRLWQGYGFN